MNFALLLVIFFFFFSHLLRFFFSFPGTVRPTSQIFVCPLTRPGCSVVFPSAPHKLSHDLVSSDGNERFRAEEVSSHPVDATLLSTLCRFTQWEREMTNLFTDLPHGHLVGERQAPDKGDGDAGKLVRKLIHIFHWSFLPSLHGNPSTCEKAGQLSGGIERENPFTQ